MLQSAPVRQYYMSQDVEAFLLARINPTELNIQRAMAATRNPELPATRQMMNLMQLLGEFGRENEIYPMLLRWGSPEQLGSVSGVFFRPPLRKFRQDRRFMQLAVRAGLVPYWRASGKWPDFCFEADLPYDCKEVATKLAS